jgi:hypothetical protein
MTRKLAVLCSLFVAVVLFAGLASAQTVVAPSPYRVDYFANASSSGSSAATLRLDNDGAASDANLCADIYVFNANEEISECCSCLETPDDLLTLNVNTNLLSNPANGIPTYNGVIKVVAAATAPGNACPLPTHITLVTNAEIQGWGTHIQANGSTTETNSQVSYLSSAEESHLAKLCGAIQAVDSGTGVCNCTGAGD